MGASESQTRSEHASQAFEDRVARQPALNATQLMFVRTLRQTLLSRARIATLAQLQEPPFSRIGDPVRLFTPVELDDILGLAQALAA